MSGQAIRNTNMPRERTDIDYRAKEFWLGCTWCGENFRVCFLSRVQGHPEFQSRGVSTRANEREAKFFQLTQHEEHFFFISSNLLSRSCIISSNAVTTIKINQVSSARRFHLDCQMDFSTYAENFPALRQMPGSQMPVWREQQK